ncbi:serine hydrolase domain-containing protein [Streptomyces sp. NPDC018019]|uniref:serine hydrolase domain-containing protein n=1 Tax=Streptomyces sp. NPDC018019 TaxID=3365030 RepID=UPI0037BD36B4
MSLPPPGRRRARLAATATAVLLALLAPALPASAAEPPAAPAAATTAAHRTALDRKALDRTLQDMHKAGMYGAYSAVRDGDASWQGASGVADIKTGRPTTPWLRHRIGSITKTFTSVAVLQQVGKGRIGLDAPIGRYLPDLFPGERGQAVTVRMLLNHTSGIADYDTLIWKTPDDVERLRFHQWDPRELVRIGLEAPPEGKPGEAYHYANTNYVIAGLLLHKVTGKAPEKYITDHVIRKAGLRNTYFPRSAQVTGPHAEIYEGMYGLFDPPRDFTVHNMSWAGTAGSLISTMGDLNQFMRALLTGKLLGPAELRQMKTTVPTDTPALRYGLGLMSLDRPCGRFWGHNGLVWGAETMSLSSEDGKRQLSYGTTLTRYNEIGEDGYPKPSPIDFARVAHMDQALCGTAAQGTKETHQTPPPDSLNAPVPAR